MVKLSSVKKSRAMVSHSVTCQLTQVNGPHLKHSQMLVLDLTT